MTKFAEGVSAYRNRATANKLGIALCPYAKGYARKEWMKGRDAAQRAEFA